MHLHGLQGVVRGQKKTTIPGPAQPCPDDKVNQQFAAAMPNQLWGEQLSAIGPRTMASDFTYVSTWAGMVYFAFIIDVFARKIVGWRVSTSMTTSFVLDAVNQAICQRCPTGGGLIHHSDRGSQHLSIRYTERLDDAGIDTSVGSVGDSYDCECAMMREPKPMPIGELRKEKSGAKSYAASSDTSSAKYTAPCAPHRPGHPPLDKHRSINAAPSNPKSAT